MSQHWYQSGYCNAGSSDGAFADFVVLYAGAQPDFVGLDQVNLRLPRSLAGRGEIDVALSFDGKAANTVRVAIK